jgi:hypothetical protein
MGSSRYTDAAKLAAELQGIVNSTLKPPSETAAFSSEPVIYISLVKGTRGYIEKLAHQINGTYANAWYDACAVMIRRLVETLIIEAYEAHSIQDRIHDSNGDYFFLRDLVDRIVSEPTFNLGRNSKKILPKLKDIGDKSAHSRRFIAHREDLERILDDLRTVVQELLYVAKLK